MYGSLFVCPKGREVLCYTPGCPSIRPSFSNFLYAELLQLPSELVETCHNKSPCCLFVHVMAVGILKLSALDF